MRVASQRLLLLRAQESRRHRQADAEHERTLAVADTDANDDHGGKPSTHAPGPALRRCFSVARYAENAAGLKVSHTAREVLLFAARRADLLFDATPFLNTCSDLIEE